MFNVLSNCQSPVKLFGCEENAEHSSQQNSVFGLELI